MPTLKESWGSQGLETTPDEQKADPTWVVSGVDDDVQAGQYAFFHLPQNFGPAKLARMRVGTRLGSRTWAIETHYTTKRKEAINKDAVEGNSDPVTDGEVIRYGIGSEVRNIKKSLATTGYPDFFGDPPDEGGLIGVDSDGVHGVDINYGLVSFSVTKQFQNQDLTAELREAWEELSDPQHINDDTFRSYPAGEVRFDGVSDCTIEGSPTHLIPITFNFSRRRNQIDVDMGQAIVIPLVKGWQVIDPRYKTDVDEANSKMKRELQYVYVHDVLPSGDFSRLGIAV